MDIDFDVTTALEDAAITIDVAKADKSEDLFAINTSDMRGRLQKGDVILYLTSTDGLKHRVPMPETWIPWELSHYFPKKIWLANIDFVKNVRKGVITLVDPEIARTILKSNDGSEEYQRCIDRIIELENGVSQRRESLEDAIASEENRQTVKNAIEANKGNAAPKTNSSNVAVHQPDFKIVTIMNNKSFDEPAKINALRNIQKSIKKADIQWMMGKCQQKENKLKEYLLSLRSSAK